MPVDLEKIAKMEALEDRLVEEAPAYPLEKLAAIVEEGRALNDQLVRRLSRRQKIVEALAHILKRRQADAEVLFDLRTGND